MELQLDQKWKLNFTKFQKNHDIVEVFNILYQLMTKSRNFPTIDP